MSNPLFQLVMLISLVAMGSLAHAQDRIGPGSNQGVSREAMWPAPTAEDWKKPCLIEWQRTWEDAVAVSKETGKAILVCINMDGEIASEHYAGVRYRQPEIAAVYKPYVTVIASVYRHTPRDYDDEGYTFDYISTVGVGVHGNPTLYEADFDVDARLEDPAICPAGHFATEQTQPTKPPNRVVLTFDRPICEGCVLFDRCPAQLNRTGDGYMIQVDLVAANLERRRRAIASGAFRERYRLRAGIEATGSELKRGHGLGALRVRGRPRVVVVVSLPTPSPGSGHPVGV